MNGLRRHGLVALSLAALVACGGDRGQGPAAPSAQGRAPVVEEEPGRARVVPLAPDPDAPPPVPPADLPAGGGVGPIPAPVPRRPTPEESHEWMVQRLEEIRARTPDTDPYQGDFRVRQLRKQLALHGAQPPWRLVRQLGLAEMRVGFEEESIAHLEEALELMQQGPLGSDAVSLRQLHFDLGIACLRLAETENCCAKPNPDSCILPLEGGGLHATTRGAEMARDHLVQALQYAEKDTPPWYAAVWLLNLAHQTLNTWPGGMAEEHRLPEATFARDAAVPRFRNVAQELGVDTFSLAGGIIVDDFTGDGWLDLMVSSWDTSHRLRFFVNQGDGTFQERGEQAGLGGLLGGLNMLQADYDNDGDLDFLVLRGAWLSRAGRHPNSLVRNNGDGTFTDVTAHLGLAGTGLGDFPTQTADWADYDLDGDLDLYIGNESTAQFPCGSQLFRNDGERGFTEVAAQAGVANRGYCKGVSWGDFDNDGDPDLYVSNNGEPNRLYRNNGDGTFTDVAPELRVAGPTQSFPCWFWDRDNDGNLDLFVAAYATDIDEIAAHYLGRGPGYEGGRFYQGDGNGGFSSATLAYPALPMGSNFGDLDGDGRLDFLLSTGNTYIHTVMPNLLFRQQPDGTFWDATMASGLGHVQKGHGIAFADLDHDGDLDVFAEMGGAYAGDGYYDTLFQNPGSDNGWVAVELRGTRSNRCALGARIEVVPRGAKDGPRSIHRVVGSGGSFGASPLRQVIGVGDATGIQQITVRWPGSGGKRGSVQTWRDLPLARRITLVEGEAEAEIAAMPSVRLGGG